MATEPHVNSLDEKNRRTLKFLIGIIIASFIFAIVSIPLYRMVCDSIDPGGSSWSAGDTDTYVDVKVDSSRTIRVRLTTNVNRQLPWEFKPLEPNVSIHPGERKMVKFHAKNLDVQGSITGKAVYDINPPEAGEFFKKIECFCFQEQELKAGESVEMTLVFWFDPAMPAEITEVTLAYTFFNMDSTFERTLKERARKKQQGQ